MPIFLELSLKRAQSSGKKKWENLTTARYYLVLINARGGLTSPVRVYSVKVPKSKYSQKENNCHLLQGLVSRIKF